MRSKFESRTENILDDKDRFYVHYNELEDKIDFSFHDARDSVAQYTMSSHYFLKFLSLSIDDFDNTELEILKKISSVLFTQIKKIELKNNLDQDAVDSSEAA